MENENKKQEEQYPAVSLIEKNGGSRVLIECPEVNLEVNYSSERGNYADVKAKLIKYGKKLPRGKHVAALIEAGLNVSNYSDNVQKYLEPVKDKLREGLWIYSNLLQSSKGVYVYDDLYELEESELVKKLEEGDKSVRFVPNGYKSGAQNAEEFEKNPLAQAIFGEEGAKRIAKVSKQYSSGYDKNLRLDLGDKNSQIGLRLSSDPENIVVEGSGISNLPDKEIENMEKEIENIKNGMENPRKLIRPDIWDKIVEENKDAWYRAKASGDHGFNAQYQDPNYDLPLAQGIAESAARYWGYKLYSRKIYPWIMVSAHAYSVGDSSEDKDSEEYKLCNSGQLLSLDDFM